jgi:uncharacterized protein YeaO (DUF488 family)
MFKIKRIYENHEQSDGYRVLIDRVWPRGMSKEQAHIDLWLKEIAPSTELRKWFNHEIDKWEEFQKKYRGELQAKKDLVHQLKALEEEHKVITLLYGAKDTEHNQAIVLLKLLMQK